MNDQFVLTESDAIELYTLLVMSARTQLDEPAKYASMRLLDVATRMAMMIEGNVSPVLQTMLTETTDSISQSYNAMADKTAYAAAIDTVCAQVATFLVATSELGNSADATS